MFRSFFSAVRRLTVSVEALASSFDEANERFRSNLLDGEVAAAPEALPAPEGKSNGRKAKVTS